MDTFMDEIKNIKMLTRVVAVGVLVNFAIIALLQGPEAVGFDPTFGTITAILNFVIAFCTSGVLMGIYVVFDVKKTFDLAHMHNVLFVAVCVQMIFSLGAVFTYNSVFENVLTASQVGAIGGSITNTIFFLYGMYAYLDTAEREHFTSQEHEILITQVQYQPMTKTDTSIDLTYFNHPVRALHLTTSNVSGTGWASDYSFDTASLYINGLALFENGSNTFHHNVVHEMHTTTLAPSSLDAVPLFTWPFCLTMNRSQPSGSLNFSRIDNAKLTIQSPSSGANDGLYRVYAVNYNILRVKDGMAGIAFSN